MKAGTPPKQMAIKNEAGYAPCSVPIWIPVFFALLWLIASRDVPGRKKTGMVPGWVGGGAMAGDHGQTGQAEQGQGHHTEFIPGWSFSHHAQSANVEIGDPRVRDSPPLFYQCLSVSICGSMGRRITLSTSVKTFLSVILSCNLCYSFAEVYSRCAISSSI